MTDFCVKICSSLIASPISTELETTEKFLPTVRIHVVLCFESLALLLKSAYCRTELEHNDLVLEFFVQKVFETHNGRSFYCASSNFITAIKLKYAFTASGRGTLVKMQRSLILKDAEVQGFLLRYTLFLYYYRLRMA